MALIVEDGTGKADAESYASVAEADAYHAKRNNTAWALLSEEVKEANLRKATDYMLQVYRLRWNGSRQNGVQALDHPRSFMPRNDFYYSGLNGYTYIAGNYYYPNNIVVVEVKNACIELSLRANAGELAPDLTQGVKREKIDVIEVEYDQYSTQYVRYRAIDNMLAPFLSGMGSGGQRRVIRT